jgi:hypothetical protein
MSTMVYTGLALAAAVGAAQAVAVDPNVLPASIVMGNAILVSRI